MRKSTWLCDVHEYYLRRLEDGLVKWLLDVEQIGISVVGHPSMDPCEIGIGDWLGYVGLTGDEALVLWDRG